MINTILNYRALSVGRTGSDAAADTPQQPHSESHQGAADSGHEGDGQPGESAQRDHQRHQGECVLVCVEKDGKERNN